MLTPFFLCLLKHTVRCHHAPSFIPSCRGLKAKTNLVPKLRKMLRSKDKHIHTHTHPHTQTHTQTPQHNPILQLQLVDMGLTIQMQRKIPLKQVHLWAFVPGLSNHACLSLSCRLRPMKLPSYLSDHYPPDIATSFARQAREDQWSS